MSPLNQEIDSYIYFELQDRAIILTNFVMRMPNTLVIYLQNLTAYKQVKLILQNQYIKDVYSL